jgi:hypothetical protein
MRLAMVGIVAAVVLTALAAFVAWKRFVAAARADQTVQETQRAEPPTGAQPPPSSIRLADRWPDAQPRRANLDTGGFGFAISSVLPISDNASLKEISNAWQRVGLRGIQRIDQVLADENRSPKERVATFLSKAALLNYEGQPQRAYEVLCQARAIAEAHDDAAAEQLYNIVYMQGLTSLRRGEDENCIQCRGESSCILPIAPAAVHTNPAGSRQAIVHFTEYLAQFPDDLEVRWLLNLAHMTLGEHPERVDPRYLITLDRFRQSEFDIGRFRDVGHVVGVNRFNQSGGAIMDDFDNDGLLDVAVSTFDPTQSMAFYRNTGKGTFEDRTSAAGVAGQLGGMYCVQTDYNNDGYLDILVMRGAWVLQPMRPSLLRNRGNGTFTDVTEEAGLLEPVNSITASWADYDNDGWLDVFICCERQANRLYRNRGNGTFEEVLRQAGLHRDGNEGCKGAAWIDYDNDGYQDLFLNYLSLSTSAKLFHNERNGTFSDASAAMGLSGPPFGFSCWAWDFDNDGWLDIFATCYDRSLGDIVKGLLGLPHSRHSNVLYRNQQGNGFADVTAEAGLDMVFSTMGSNFGDFDNDGFLDMYLATGEPNLATLVPNRMLKNVDGCRFADITASSGTGNLQKGHAVACGDWDRDGDTDIFIEMGGAQPGDRYHNVLFQNPGQKNHWLSLKLIGKKTNRPGIGARIKVVTAGEQPLTIHRHVSSGSSFGANSLEQTIGLGSADRISLLEIRWPASGTTQVFREIAADQVLEITEFADDYLVRPQQPIPLPATK